MARRSEKARARSDSAVMHELQRMYPDREIVVVSRK
jgi:hypothetical protein